MIQKILAPIDIEGQNSKHLIKYAINLSKVFGAKLIYFHTYKLPEAHFVSGSRAGWSGSSEHILDQYVTEQELLNEKAFQSLIQKFPEIKTTPHDNVSKPGMLVDLLNEQVEGQNVDIILMGTNEAVGIEAFIGTIAEKVTRISPCPVIVTPLDRPYSPLKKICLAIEPDHSINEEDLSVLLLLVKGFNVSLDVLWLNDESVESEDSEIQLFTQLKKHFDKYQINYSFNSFTSDDVERSIVDYAKRNSIDLLALVYREHGFFKRMFKPGLRKKLVAQSELPLLVLK